MNALEHLVGHFKGYDMHGDERVSVVTMAHSTRCEHGFEVLLGWYAVRWEGVVGQALALAEISEKVWAVQTLNRKVVMPERARRLTALDFGDFRGVSGAVVRVPIFDEVPETPRHLQPSGIDRFGMVSRLVDPRASKVICIDFDLDEVSK